MAEQTTIEVLFHGLMVFTKPSNGQLMAAFLRGPQDNPVPDHRISVTLQERPGQSNPGDLLPFPIPLLLDPAEDIHLRVQGTTAPPLTFEPGSLIILNGPGFNDGQSFTVGDRFFPRFFLHNGAVSGSDNHEVIVLQPDGVERSETRSFVLLAQIALGDEDKAVLTCGQGKRWEFYNKGDGTKYRLWISNLPNRPGDPHAHHLGGHFRFYYAFGFPEVTNRYDLKPLTASGRYTYERPCMGVGLK